jgi:RNA recognition motif-containing protein
MKDTQQHDDTRTVYVGMISSLRFKECNKTKRNHLFGDKNSNVLMSLISRFKGNLPFTITSRAVKRFFSKFGTVTRVEIPKLRVNGKSRG